MASSADRIMTEGNILDDDECSSLLGEVQEDINDVMNLIDDKQYVKALDELDELQEKIDFANVYLSTKAKE